MTASAEVCPRRPRALEPTHTVAPDTHEHDRPTDDDASNDSGRATVEVVFLGVLLLIPVVYILISLLRLQAATFAVTQAARDAGRAIDAAPTIGEGIDRAGRIAAIDLADQHVPGDSISLRFVAAGAGCDDGEIAPSLAAGAVYDVCVRAVVTLPGVPTAVTGSHNTVTGVYTIHVGDLREGP